MRRLLSGSASLVLAPGCLSLSLGLSGGLSLLLLLLLSRGLPFSLTLLLHLLLPHHVLLLSGGLPLSLTLLLDLLLSHQVLLLSGSLLFSLALLAELVLASRILLCSLLPGLPALFGLLSSLSLLLLLSSRGLLTLEPPLLAPGVELCILVSRPGGPLSLRLLSRLLLCIGLLLLPELPHLAPGTPVALRRPLGQCLDVQLPISINSTLAGSGRRDRRYAVHR